MQKQAATVDSSMLHIYIYMCVCVCVCVCRMFIVSPIKGSRNYIGILAFSKDVAINVGHK